MSWMSPVWLDQRDHHKLVPTLKGCETLGDLPYSSSSIAVARSKPRTRFWISDRAPEDRAPSRRGRNVERRARLRSPPPENT